MTINFGALATAQSGNFAALAMPITYTPNPLAVLGSALKGWWRPDLGVTLASGTATALQDQSGQAATLSVSATGLYPAYIVQAIRIADGLKSSIAGSNSTTLSSAALISSLAFEHNQPFSLCFSFIYAANAAGTPILFGQFENSIYSNYRGWFVSLDGGVVVFNLIDSFNVAPISGIRVTGSTMLVPGVRYNVTMTYSGSTAASGVGITLNGVPETPAIVMDSLGANTTVPGAGSMRLFGQNGAILAYATLLDVSVANRAFTTADQAGMLAYMNSRY